MSHWYCTSRLTCFTDCTFKTKNLFDFFSLTFRPKDSELADKIRHLSREQGVGVELLQPDHQHVIGVDHILHEATCERKPVRASRHLQALGDGALAQPPHVIITFMEESVQALFLNEPCSEQRRYRLTEL